MFNQKVSKVELPGHVSIRCLFLQDVTGGLVESSSSLVHLCYYA